MATAKSCRAASVVSWNDVFQIPNSFTNSCLCLHLLHRLLGAVAGSAFLPTRTQQGENSSSQYWWSEGLMSTLARWGAGAGRKDRKGNNRQLKLPLLLGYRCWLI